MSKTKPVRFRLFPKQAEAFRLLRDKHTTELCYGGAAGGAKTFLGCAWQIINRIQYPGTRGFIGRARYKTLQLTTLKTFRDVGYMMGLEAGKHYRIQIDKGLIVFSNGSEIVLKDLFLYPSDPDFNALGSLEITDAFIDEAAEVSETAVRIVASRIRYKLQKMGLPPKILLTCNPHKGWLYHKFYKPYTENQLADGLAFLPANLNDNAAKDFAATYAKQLAKLDAVNRARLLAGDWEYADDSLSLFPQSVLCMLRASDGTGLAEKQLKTFISADIARFGKDFTVIGVWRGLHLVEVSILDKSSTVENARAIQALAEKWAVSIGRIVIDTDGVGGGVADLLPGCVQFHAQARPMQKLGEPQDYQHLKAQCTYTLAQLMEEGKISMAAHLAEKPFGHSGLLQTLRDELAAIRRKPAENNKLAIGSKSQLKAWLGRSPDVADMLMLRMYFELKPQHFSWN